MISVSAVEINIQLSRDYSDFAQNVKRRTRWNTDELKVWRGTGKISRGITRAGCTVGARVLLNALFAAKSLIIITRVELLAVPNVCGSGKIKIGT